jgi:hypothetical protein
MKSAKSSCFILLVLLGNDVWSQAPYPSCMNELVERISNEHKSNPCNGGTQLIRIDRYSYADTILFHLVFNSTPFCPDYVNSTLYYDNVCQVNIAIRDGGLKYRHEGKPAWVDMKQLKFIGSIQAELKKKEYNIDPGPLKVSGKGKALEHFYLGMNVENLWMAGSHVDWETGVADKPDARAGNHTHCSAFNAAGCERLGIYILRPPQHGQLLLANAQYDWLQSAEGHNNGWASLQSNNRTSLYMQVQQMANDGNVIVAVIKNPDQSKPGHAALIMPKAIEVGKIQESGPMVIMAGKHNFNYISLKNGFKSHLTNWPEQDIQFLCLPG